jgi:hypothetical protein
MSDTGLALAPRDLPRTARGSAGSVGAASTRSRCSLGHASLQTTERYVGSRQEIRTAVNDRLGIP